ncbi:MAG: DUF3137 domain-containing protein [Candidatus Gastranaerophilaceae bacterium]
MKTPLDRYRNNFAIEFAKIMGKHLPMWQKTQKENIKALYTSWVPFYIFMFLSGFIPGKHETDYFNNLHIHFWYGIFIVFVMIITAIGIENKSFQKSVKKSLFGKLLKVFCDDVIYPGYVISGRIYEDSGLLSKKFSTRETDDCFSGRYKDVPFQIEETEIYNVKTAKKKKDEVVTTLFKGVAMRFVMDKNIKAKVLIYSKSLMRRTPKGYEKVNFEYEEFNKKYDVYVKDLLGEAQVEVRYLFNTLFLERFMQLQTAFRVKKLECSVCGKEVLFLLHTNKDLFEMNHLFGKIDDFRQYERLFNEFSSVLSFIEVLNLSSKTGL